MTIRKVLQLSLGFSLFISIVLHVCTELVMALLLSLVFILLDGSCCMFALQ